MKTKLAFKDEDRQTTTSMYSKKGGEEDNLGTSSTIVAQKNDPQND